MDAPPDRKWFQTRVGRLIADQDFDAALETCEAGLKVWRWHPQLWQFKLQILTQLGRYPEALQVANDTSNHSGPARGTVGFQLRAFDLHLKQHDFAAARRRVAKIAEIDPEAGVPYLHCVGRLGLASGRHDEALRILHPRLPEFPDAIHLHTVAARNMAACGRVEDALAVLRDILARTPPGERAEPLLMITYIEILLKEGRDAEAAEFLDRHGDQVAASPRLAIERAKLFERGGAFDQARDLLRSAIADSPRDIGLNVALWRLLARAGRSREAAALCETYVDPDGASVRVVLAASGFLYDIGMPEKAESILRAAHAAHPDNVRINLRIINSLLNRSFDPQAALSLLDELTTGTPEDVTFARLRARAQRLTGFIPEAIATLEDLHARGKLDEEGIFQLAGYAALIGRFDRARALLTFVKQDSTDMRQRKNVLLAGIAFQEGDLGAARTGILRAIALCGPDVWRLDELSKFQMLAGDYGAAWANQLKRTNIIYENRVDTKTSRKPVRSLMGQILNEHRLFYGDRDGFGLRWGASVQDDARRFFRAELDRTPGNTPAALALLGALFRTGHITEEPQAVPPETATERIPKLVHQFWDSPELPEAVADVMTWNRGINPDYEFRRFDLRQAWDYLIEKGEDRALNAVNLAMDAAGQSDILRLVVLWHEGGVWLDVDDRCVTPFSRFLDHRMRFIGYQEHFWSVGNNFLAVQPRDPIIRAALEDAIEGLTGPLGTSVWLASGPGAISRSLARVGTDAEGFWQEGIWVMPVHRMQQLVVPHIRLPYKNSQVHWVKRLQSRDD